jgi:hypothetical protein
MSTQIAEQDTDKDPMQFATERVRSPRRLRSQAGMALPMAIGIMMVLSISIGTVIVTTTANQGSTKRATADDKALTLAEAGLNNALSVLYASSNPTSASAVTSGSTSLNGGTSSYTGSLSGTTWTVTGTGTVPSPVAGGGNVTRSTSIKVDVGLNPGSPWYYTFTSTGGGCMSLKKDAVITTPLYVNGNLCLGKDNVITGSPLVVTGTVSMGNGATIGTPGAPLAQAHLVGGCTGGATHPCTTADDVYATLLDQTSPGLSKPPVDLTTWYAQAKPGPSNSCTTGSVPGNFDNDGNGPNNSRAAFDLLPAAAYDCRVTDGSGNIVGRISWVPGSPGTLTVVGTIFFDGGISISGDAVYQGRATIYASGSVDFGMGATLCGISGCTSGWDWNTNLLMLVSGSTASGDTFTMNKDVIFQGMAYANGNFSAKKDAVIWGPIIANDMDFAKDGAIGTYPSTVPPGAPGAAGNLTPTQGSWRG